MIHSVAVLSTKDHFILTRFGDTRYVSSADGLANSGSLVVWHVLSTSTTRLRLLRRLFLYPFFPSLGAHSAHARSILWVWHAYHDTLMHGSAGLLMFIRHLLQDRHLHGMWFNGFENVGKVYLQRECQYNETCTHTLVQTPLVNMLGHCRLSGMLALNSHVQHTVFSK